jgi:hypothetical protein
VTQQVSDISHGFLRIWIGVQYPFAFQKMFLRLL